MSNNNYYRDFDKDEPLPSDLTDCFAGGFCTYMVTGTNYHSQKWYSLPETPHGQGFCAVCARAHFLDRQSDWIHHHGGFFCDWGHAGKSSRIFTPPPAKSAPADSDQAEWNLMVDDRLSFDKDSLKFNRRNLSHLFKKGTKSEMISNDLPKASQYDFFHSNLMQYFRLCWNSHAGLVIRPEMLWFVVANQLAGHIRDNPEPYRSIFTVGEGKTKLLFVVPNPDDLKIALIIKKLSEVIPGNAAFSAEQIINAFNPVVSTSTPESRVATAAAFCEAMEAYYMYDTTCCGISKVKVLGTPADWLKLAESCDQLNAILSVGNLKDCSQYLTKMAARFREAAKMISSTWKDFFRIENCGSGHDSVLVGWATELYSLLKPPQQIYGLGGGGAFGGDVNDYEDGSSVSYLNIDTNMRFRKCFGVLSSRLDDKNYLWPHFNQVVICDGKAEETEGPELQQDQIPSPSREDPDDVAASQYVFGQIIKHGEFRHDDKHKV